MSTIWPSVIAPPDSKGPHAPGLYQASLPVDDAVFNSSPIHGPVFGDGAVDEYPRILPGYIRPSVNDTFYHRIIITPYRLDLGSVASEQSSPVHLWNGFFHDVTLNSISGVGEGLTLEGQPEPPFVFKSLEQKDWIVRISPEGPPTISDEVFWTFNNYEVSLPITGTRVSAWGLAMDWSSPTIERLEWLTSITQSPAGGEQRRKLRLTPRRSFKLQSIANHRDRQYVEAKIAENAGREWAVPIHQSEQRLKEELLTGDQFIPCDTAYMNFVPGQLVILYGARPWQHELCEIDAVELTGLRLFRPLNGNWGVGTRIAVAVSGRMVNQPTATKVTDDLYTYSLDFTQTSKAEWGGSITLPLYRDRYVILDKPEESEELTGQYIRLLEITDTRINLPMYRDTAGIGFTAHAMRWQVIGRAAQARLKSLYYLAAGKWKSFWIPTHNQDVKLVGITGPTEVNLTVEWAGYTETYSVDRLGRRDVQILMRNGDSHFARIIRAEEVVKYETERLIMDVSAGVELSKDTVDRISFLVPSRLDQDFVEIYYETDSEGVASSRVVFRSVTEKK